MAARSESMVACEKLFLLLRLVDELPEKWVLNTVKVDEASTMLGRED